MLIWLKSLLRGDVVDLRMMRKSLLMILGIGREGRGVMNFVVGIVCLMIWRMMLSFGIDVRVVE